MKSENGVTLIALVVTIIVILILSGVSITLILNDDGIILQSIESKEESELAELKQSVVLTIAGATSSYYEQIYTHENVEYKNMLISEHIIKEVEKMTTIENLKSVTKVNGQGEIDSGIIFFNIESNYYLINVEENGKISDWKELTKEQADEEISNFLETETDIETIV